MSKHPFRERVISNLQPESPLAQFETVLSHTVAGRLGEAADPHLVVTSFQGVVKSDVTPEPLFVQTKPQLPRPLLTGLVVQTRSPSLDQLQHLKVLCKLRWPKA